MARSDLLISLVKAGTSGNQALFRKVVESVIAEERAKKHDILATRLADELSRNGNSSAESRTMIANNGTVQDLCFEITPSRTLNDLVLKESIKNIASEVIEEHHRSDLLRSYGLTPRNRILLAGSPGNGKTSFAETLSHGLMVPLIVARYDGLIASYLGETAARLKRLFDYVRTRHCVLFFDEFDTLGKERGDEHETGEIKRVVSSLLLQMDDLPSHVVVVTATNHPELLDRAVWRRFQVRLELSKPDLKERELFFEKVSSRFETELGFTPHELAKKLDGYSYSELEDFISDVARRYVLSLPGANAEKIISERLKQWNNRYSM